MPAHPFLSAHGYTPSENRYVCHFAKGAIHNGLGECV